MLFSCMYFSELEDDWQQSSTRDGMSSFLSYVLRIEDGPVTGFDAGGVGLSFWPCSPDWPPTRHRVCLRAPRLFSGHEHREPLPRNACICLPSCSQKPRSSAADYDSDTYRHPTVASSLVSFRVPPSPPLPLLVISRKTPEVIQTFQRHPPPPSGSFRIFLKFSPFSSSLKRDPESLLLLALCFTGFWLRGSPSLSLG